MVFADQTVWENLLLGGYSQLRRYPKRVPADRERVLELFPRLRERLQQEAGTLSGGEQQMLAIARGLLCNPRLLVIDELSLGLAPLVLDMLFPVLQKLNEQGLSVLLVEQMASYALAVTHRTYVMENGRMLFDGPSADLAHDARVLTRISAGAPPPPSWVRSTLFGAFAFLLCLNGPAVRSRGVAQLQRD